MRVPPPRVTRPLTQIQHDGITSKLRNLGGTQGRGSTPSLGDVLHPVAIVEDLSQDTWYSGEGQDKPGGAGVEIAGGVGTIPVVEFWNPNPTNVVLIDFLNVCASTTLVFYVIPITAVNFTGGGTPTQAFPSLYRDARAKGVPGLQIFTDITLAGLPGLTQILWVGAAGAAVNATVSIQHVLGGNAGIAVVVPTLNATLRVTGHWRERHQIRPNLSS